MQNAVVEHRTFEFVEIRALDGGGVKLFGHAAVFNTLSDDLGGFREKVEKGAFADTILNDDIVACATISCKSWAVAAAELFD